MLIITGNKAKYMTQPENTDLKQPLTFDEFVNKDEEAARLKSLARSLKARSIISLGPFAASACCIFLPFHAISVPAAIFGGLSLFCSGATSTIGNRADKKLQSMYQEYLNKFNQNEEVLPAKTELETQETELVPDQPQKSFRGFLEAQKSNNPEARIRLW